MNESAAAALAAAAERIGPSAPAAGPGGGRGDGEGDLPGGPVTADGAAGGTGRNGEVGAQTGGPGSAPAGEGPPEPRLTVAAVARRLGVAPATLRTWDRRYGLGPSAHEAGAHRRYTGSDLRRLDAMRRLTLEGVAPADAARIVLAQPDPGPPPAAEGGGGAAAPAHATRPARRGGGRVLALPSASPASRGLARAAMALDAGAVSAMVRTAVTTTGVVRTWEELLRPVLVAAGRRWQVTGEGVEVEHLLSEVVGGVFRTFAAAAAEQAHRRPVLLAAAPDDQHALPLTALAAALAEHDVATRLLGAALPEAALQAAVRRTGPAAVFVWSQLPTSGDPAVLAALPQTRPPASLVAGGPGWDPAALPERVAYAEDLGHAVELVRTAVGA